MIYYRVLLLFIKFGGLIHQSIKIRYAIARLDSTRNRWFPAGQNQSGDISFFNRGQKFAVGIPKHRYRWNIGLGITIYEVPPGWRQSDLVRSTFRRQQSFVL